jgi:hypothetical protein
MHKRVMDIGFYFKEELFFLKQKYAALCLLQKYGDFVAV